MNILGNFVHLKRLQLAVLAVLAAALTVVATVVYADDNTDWRHWHSESPQYRLLTDQLPDAWENPIRNAADEWDDETNISLTESSSSNNTIWRGAIPQEWWGKCAPSLTAACTWIQYSNNHLHRAQMVFNWDHSFNTASWKCWFDIGLDVETYALHEFGHFAGFLNHSNDSDAVMHIDLQNCERNLDSHDVQSMNTQYNYQH